MSIAGLVGTSRTDTNKNDYDHAIILVDATLPKEEAEGTPEDAAVYPLRSGSGVPLSRKWTKGMLGDELTKRKYAKWQADKANDEEGAAELSKSFESDARREIGSGETETLKRSLTSTSRLRDRIPFQSKRQTTKSKTNDDAHVDILYENQRGWFFCGIPLYSNKSLLPIDPPSWQTGTFRDSPVNITNAQLPDPSWGWAWRRWYVDMSYDVDEEGWQYSFHFYQKYAWHGTHPWFHSFARRRRWLRKRVKIHPIKTSRDLGKLRQAHLLNEDYFTIHAARDRSRESSVNRAADKRSSLLSTTNDSDNEQDSGDITDILKLMAVLRRARVDREKLSAVKLFVDQGGEDLVYLADRMRDIMRVFVYRTSQQQLYNFLQHAQDHVNEQMQRPQEGAESENEAVKRETDNLIRAVQAASTYLSEENITETSTDFDGPTEPSIFPTEEQGSEERTTIADEIKGISEDAEISEKPGIWWDSPLGQDSGPSAANKGKDKA